MCILRGVQFTVYVSSIKCSALRIFGSSFCQRFRDTRVILLKMADCHDMLTCSCLNFH